MKKTFGRLALAVVTMASLSACGGQIGTGSQYEPGPVGTGSSIQELKGTPCACLEIPMNIPGSDMYAQGVYGA